MSNVEKTVEKCQITLNVQRARLVFKLYCKHGIVKTHNLAFIECETLQAVFSKDMCPNQLTAQPRLLCDTVINFQSNQEEVSLIVSPEKITFKNYVDDEPDPSKVVHTALNLDPDEFDNCQIGVDTEITFCLKEFRAVLAFAEITAMPLNIKFETSGRPIVLSIDADSAFEANFVLATLAESQSQTGNSTNSTTQQRTASTGSRSYASRGRLNRGRSQNQANNYKNSNHNRLPERNKSSNDADLMDDDFDDEILVPNIARAANVLATNTKYSHTGKTFPPCSSGSSLNTSSQDNRPSPVIQPPLHQSVLEDVHGDDDEDEDMPVPGTPPQKKFRSMFFGMSQASSAVSQETQDENGSLFNRQVLVEDTDEEEDD